MSAPAVGDVFYLYDNNVKINVYVLITAVDGDHINYVVYHGPSGAIRVQWDISWKELHQLVSRHH